MSTVHTCPAASCTCRVGTIVIDTDSSVAAVKRAVAQDHAQPRLTLWLVVWQNYNNELVKCIEDLKEKREEVNRQILQDEVHPPPSPTSSPASFPGARPDRFLL